MKGKSWKCVSFNKIDRFMVKCRCWENGGFFRLPGFWRRSFHKERHEWFYFYFVDALLRFLEPGSGYICLGPTYLTNHPTDFLSLSISQKILDIICNFCIHDDMYTEPQIYHLSFDIKSTKNSTEYNTIWDAINTVFETYRDNDCYIDILDSSCLIFSFETEKEIMNKLKNAIIANYGDSDKFWYFISSVNSQYDSYCLTKDKRVLFNEFSKTAFGF